MDNQCQTYVALLIILANSCVVLFLYFKKIVTFSFLLKIIYNVEVSFTKKFMPKKSEEGMSSHFSHFFNGIVVYTCHDQDVFS